MNEAEIMEAVFAARSNEDLQIALDRAMSYAYSDGRADERAEWIEKAIRAMNETGQGEHGVTRVKDERPNQAHRHD